MMCILYIHIMLDGLPTLNKLYWNSSFVKRHSLRDFSPIRGVSVSSMAFHG